MQIRSTQQIEKEWVRHQAQLSPWYEFFLAPDAHILENSFWSQIREAVAHLQAKTRHTTIYNLLHESNESSFMLRRRIPVRKNQVQMRSEKFTTEHNVQRCYWVKINLVDVVLLLKLDHRLSELSPEHGARI